MQVTRKTDYRPEGTAQADTRPNSDGVRIGGPGVTVVHDFQPCGVCGKSTKIRVSGRPGHYGCLTSNDTQNDGNPETLNAFKMLHESITTTTRNPLLRVHPDLRELAPWCLMTEPMRGEHRWRRPAPAGRMVKVFDRNGSYPSAMGNVPVASGLLRHTGPLTAYDKSLAGIFLVKAFAWPGDGPHPLGEIADPRYESWWVSTPHVRLLVRLAIANRTAVPVILDSYTNKTSSALFRQYADGVQAARAATAGTDAYGEVKRKTSIAIRALWPKGSRSPFWRPDWSISVRAEAAVRHWLRADQAAAAGAQLLRLGAVDEVGFAVPGGVAPADWVPEPYEVGAGYGKVKTKALIEAGAWNAVR